MLVYIDGLQFCESIRVKLMYMHRVLYGRFAIKTQYTTSKGSTLCSMSSRAR